MADAKTQLYIWNYLCSFLSNTYGAAGVMGNLQAESDLRPTNLQNSYNRSLSMTDEQYTEAVDSGTYKDFATDGAGYGLAQWTYAARKQNMYGAANVLHTSIGSLDFQLYFLCRELVNYSVVLNILVNADSVQEASDAFLTMYEKPATITQKSKDARAEFGRQFYEQLSPLTDIYEVVAYEDMPRVLKRGCKGPDVVQLQKNLIELGYDLGQSGADGSYGKKTAEAVSEFQGYAKLHVDGIAGALTQDLILQVLMDKHKARPRYTITISHLDEDTAEGLFRQFEMYPVTMEEEH